MNDSFLNFVGWTFTAVVVGCSVMFGIYAGVVLIKLTLDFLWEVHFLWEVLC